MNRMQFLAVVGSALAVQPVAAAPTQTPLRVQLLSALQMHVDRTTVSGAYLRLDLASGKVAKLYPAATHPMMLTLDEYYVLCVDFKDAGGKPVNVDFYLARKDRGFAVFHTEFANRAPLESLVKSGVARMMT